MPIGHNRVILECQECGEEADYEDGDRWERDAEDDGWDVDTALDWVICPSCAIEETEHTPGLWVEDGEEDPRELARDFGGIVIVTERGGCGATFTAIAVGSGPEAVANARLIAEAPAMYEAIANLASYDCYCGDEPWVAGTCDSCGARAILDRIDGGNG